MKTAAQIIHDHHVKMGEKGGKAGKGSERRLWAGRLAAAIRWDNAKRATECRAALEALQAGK